MRRQKLSSMVALLSLTALFACGTPNEQLAKKDAESPQLAAKGSPPTILKIDFDPPAPTLADTVYLVMDYEDPDGDVVNAYLKVVIAGRTAFDGLLTRPQAAGLFPGPTRGHAKIVVGSKFYGQPTLNVKVYLLDKAGNKSASMERNIEIKTK